MTQGKGGTPAWVWVIVAVVGCFVLITIAAPLAIYGVRRYIAAAQRADSDQNAASIPNDPGLPASGAARRVSPELDGSPVDLSTVMGRARKLADAWQPEAALLGIQATVTGGRIQTQDGATAQLTYGPSPFASAQPRTGLFVVVYDKSGIRGAPASGAVGKPLPEPMCAPEHVLPGLKDLGGGPFALRYALDVSGRPMWVANPEQQPEQERLFDPQDCRLRGLLPRDKR